VSKSIRIIEFTIIAYLIALLIDCIAYTYGFTTQLSTTIASAIAIIWGFARMWSITLATVICLHLRRVSVREWLKSVLGLSKRALVYYLISPLIVYLALGVYVIIAYPLRLFDFEAYIELLVDMLEKAVPSQVIRVEDLARLITIVQIFQAYIVAITINTIAAMGEEIGWRGYLYGLLSSKHILTSTLVIGVCWGLWHATAILLLGYNYTYNRILGVLLFTVLTITLTYPQLVVTSRARSILPACSLHGALNALWPLTLVATRLPVEQRELLLGLGVLGIVAWSITSIIIAVLIYRHKLY